MEQTSLFTSNRCQALRMPKAMAFPESVTRVDVIALGRARLIVPAGEAWQSWFDGTGDGASEDFLPTRDQPDEQKRDGV